MRKQHLLYTIIAAFVMAFMMAPTTSCIFDAEEKPPEDDGGGGGEPNFLPLDVKDNLLANLETAYEQRVISEYARLLDNDFTFFFGAQDLKDGNVDAPQWSRAEELGATGNLFSPTFIPPPQGDIVVNAPVSRIDLELTFPAGETGWQEIPPSDPVKYPNQSWYLKTVDYRLTVTAGDWTFTNANDITASFVVRFTESNNDSVWQIIEWRDDI